MSKKPDPQGDRCKEFEMREAGRLAMPGMFTVARLDGRGFSKFTKGLARPYDSRMSVAMSATMQDLVKEFRCTLGYFQSDEITLHWKPEPEQARMLFGGRFQKLHSVLAGFASTSFYKHILHWVPEKGHLTPHFDCRVWQVPTKEEVFEIYDWREHDARKNSVTMAASEIASHKDLHGKGTKDKLDLLHKHGINWNMYPSFFKRGVYANRVSRVRELTEDERLAIPAKHRPEPGVKIEVLDLPPIRRYTLWQDLIDPREVEKDA